MEHLRRLSSAASSSALSVFTPSPTRPSLSLSLQSPSTPLPGASLPPVPPTPSDSHLLTSLIVSHLETLQSIPRSESTTRLALVRKINKLLAIGGTAVREGFARHGGQLMVLSQLAGLEREGEGEGEGEGGEEMVRGVMEVLGGSLRGMREVRREFEREVGDEGVEQALRLSGFVPPAARAEVQQDQQGDATVPANDVSAEGGVLSPPSPAEQLLSILYSFLTDNFASPPLYTSLRSTLFSVLSLDTAHPPPSTSPTSLHESILTLISTRPSSERIVNAFILPLLLRVQDMVDPEKEAGLRFMVLESVRGLLEGGERALGEVGGQREKLMVMLLERMEGLREGEKEEREVVQALVGRLAQMGLGRNVASGLMKKAVKRRKGEDGSEIEEIDEEVVEILYVHSLHPLEDTLLTSNLHLHSLNSVLTSHSPPSIHFSTSTSISLHIPSLPRLFPPPTQGFTLLFWFRVSPPSSSPFSASSAPDPSPLFTLSDMHQKTYICLSLSSSNQLLFTTSSLKPSTAFTHPPLVPGKWHHLALVQPRPRYSLSSFVLLYLDGTACSSIKLPYPSTATRSMPVSGWFSSDPSPSPTSSSSSALEWSLGPTWLVEDELSREKIVLAQSLGSLYTGNFQDRLGPFQTNESARRVRVELGEEEEKAGDIVGKGRLIDEGKILFAFNAGNVDDSPFDDGINDGSLLLLNSAFALTSSSAPSFPSYLHGPSPLVLSPSPLSNTLWTLGGVPLLLHLISLSSTSHQLSLTLSLLASSLAHNWRLSEDAEKGMAYEVLGAILRRKAEAGLVDERVWDVVWELVGGRRRGEGEGEEEGRGKRETIANQVAARGLLLDLGVWGRVNDALVRRHWGRMRALMEGQGEERERAVNVRILGRMHIDKKLLFALRVGYYDALMMDEVAETLVAFMKAEKIRKETMRHVATFLTASLCPQVSNTRRPSLTSPSTTSFLLSTSLLPVGPLGPPLHILHALHDILLDRHRSVDLKLFTQIITLKWVLAFIISPSSHPHSAVLALRILVRILQSQGEVVVSKFKNEGGGFALLKVAMGHLWVLGQVQVALFALFADVDITTIELETELGLEALMGKTLPRFARYVNLAGETLRVIVAAVGKGLKSLSMGGGMEGSSPPANGGNQLSLEKGFGAILGNLSKCEMVGRLLVDKTVLAEFVVALRGHLRLSLVDGPLTTGRAGEEKLPPLVPLLTARNGFKLSASSSSGTLSPVVAPSPPTTSSFRLRLPSLSILTTSSTSSLSPLSPLPSPAPSSPGVGPYNDLDPTSAASTLRREESERAAEMLFDFLGYHIARVVAAGLLVNKGEGGPLQPVRDVFVAGSGMDMAEQVAWRTVVLQMVQKHFKEEVSMGCLVAFVKLATDQCYQGFHLDPISLLQFTLVVIERLEHLPSPTSSLLSLFTSLNRLILLTLSRPLQSPIAIQLLLSYPLVVFSADNVDDNFFRCLVSALCGIVQFKEDEVGMDVDKALACLKVLAMQRGETVEALFDLEEDVTKRLANADRKDAIALLEDCSFSLKSLRHVFVATLEAEVSAARHAIVEDLGRAKEFTKSSTKRSEVDRARRHRIELYDWLTGIQEVEATRVAHMRQDVVDHSTFIDLHWASQLHDIISPPSATSPQTWALDPTHVGSNMRKKLMLVTTTPPETRQPISPFPKSYQNRPLGPGRMDSIVDTTPMPTPPDPDAMFLVDQKTGVETAIEEDKYRKVRRSLEAGDTVDRVFNMNRIVALEAHGGLLIIAKKNIYIVDGFFQRANGELVDVVDAPADEQDVHLQTLSELARRDQRTSLKTARWHWKDVQAVHQRKYLFRQVAIELFFADGEVVLLVVLKEERAHVLALIEAHCPPQAIASGSLTIQGAGLLGRGEVPKLEIMKQKWVAREISNFDYLMFINNVAGRTFSDVTSYPVFPWILADYTSTELDFNNPATFRDLSKNMGSQNEERRIEFDNRYREITGLADGTKPFHYGTHYSSSSIVASYLIRLENFTSIYLDLQGGHFDLPDRLFSNVAKAWDSASRQSRSDIRELIPEFFFLPTFLTNVNKLEFGFLQGGERVNDVELPPWAHEDPRLFVELNRQALESDYVSSNLHLWIDLIFGVKQLGDLAVASTNCFQSLSYDGSVDLDSISDIQERKVVTSTIHNFGQTPLQLFTSAHPSRRVPLSASSTKSIFSPNGTVESQAVTLIQSITPVLTLPQVGAIHPSSTSPEKTMATSSKALLLPGEKGAFALVWGFLDHSVRVMIRKGIELGGEIGVFENLHSEAVSCACFADARTLVTASNDSTVVIWKLQGTQTLTLQQVGLLRGGHSDRVICVTASRSFSIIVSGSEDGTAIIWDLNRRLLVHRLPHDSRVHLVAISDTTGDIATCEGAVLRLWDCNGMLLATQSTASRNEPITSVAWSLSETHPIVATGHSSGRILIWKRVHYEAESTGWKLELLVTLRHKDRSPSSTPSSPSPDSSLAITSLSFTSRTLYSGDSNGRIYLWTPPGTEFYVPDVPNCMSCDAKFGIIESRRRCSSCGGLFCSLCTTTSVEVGGRFCSSCFSKLSPLMV